MEDKFIVEVEVLDSEGNSVWLFYRSCNDINVAVELADIMQIPYTGSRVIQTPIWTSKGFDMKWNIYQDDEGWRFAILTSLDVEILSTEHYKTEDELWKSSSGTLVRHVFDSDGGIDNDAVVACALIGAGFTPII